MGAGYTCMKCLFVILNIIFLICAIAGIGVAIWMFVDPALPLHFTQKSNEYLISTVIVLLASIILLFASLLGVYSVTKEARKALIVSFCLLLIIVVAEIAAGMWGYINRDKLEVHIRTSVQKTVREDYDADESVRKLFDTIQSKMHCCGALSPVDWTKAEVINLGAGATPLQYVIPRSCCRPEISSEECDIARKLERGNNPDSKFIYKRGCYTFIMSRIADSVYTIMIVAGIVLAVQVLGLILGLILSCSMNRSHRYKA